MRRFIRFSVRDLFWLTLVVAFGLAWFVRESQFHAAVQRVSSRAETWSGAAGALEFALKRQAGKVCRFVRSRKVRPGNGIVSEIVAKHAAGEVMNKVAAAV
jgi:hypothetical protein